MTALEKTGALREYSPVALRAFHEAAKHESYTLAAARMSVTQSAISHHIKSLEQQLQVKLFERHGRALRLTNEGRVLQKGMEKAYRHISETIDHIRGGGVRQRVVLGVLSSFATKWLVPRLGGFYRSHPSIELVVRSVNHTIDVKHEPFDLAVATLPAAPAAAEVKSALLWRERLFAVCSPRYAEKNQPLKRIEDLAGHTLLHDETEIAAERGFDWLSWLRYFNMETSLLKASSQYFSQSDLTLQAAIAQHGIALTRTSLAATDIKNGLLINPLPQCVIPTQTACYLCGETDGWHKPANKQLISWLLGEVKSDIAFYQRKTAQKARSA